ncbi:PE-PPE domain protein [Mycolicibacterium rhodesiae JS60]|nr:PE-PPE domain protein [Mycolicibacterium rhodesiae JS60]
MGHGRISRAQLRNAVRGVVALPVIGMVLAAPATATTVLYAGGTTGTLGQLVPAGAFGSTSDLLGGMFGADQVTSIDYPASLWPITGIFDPTLGASIASGAAALEAAVAKSAGPLVIVGTSQGATVVQQVAADLNSDPTVSSDTVFILIADPQLGLFERLNGVDIPILDYVPAALTETRFHIVIVINQYDGFADPPTKTSNLLAVLNALMGVAYIHPFAQNTDLSTVPADHITTTTNGLGGTTTIYRVPTRSLPLTMPLRQMGISPAIVDGIDERLRPLVDAGYEAAPGSAAASEASSTVPAPTDGAAAQPRSTTGRSARPPRTAPSKTASSAFRDAMRPSDLNRPCRGVGGPRRSRTAVLGPPAGVNAIGPETGRSRGR